MPVVKLFDGITVMNSAKKTKRVLTLEGGQAKGGLGGAVAEFLSENYPVPVTRMGIKDHYGESGQPVDLLKAFGLSTKHIVHNAQAFYKQHSK